MAELKNKIKQYRAKANLRQEDLAQVVGVTRQTIIAVEKGGYVPSLELGLKIAKALNQPIDNLFSYED